jgi:hypothetical protein
MMRTSTGSISVMKIIQKKNIRPGNSKNTTAKADSSEMAILPTTMTSAMIRLLRIIVSAGVPRTRAPSPGLERLRVVLDQVGPGVSGISPRAMVGASCDEPMMAR